LMARRLPIGDQLRLAKDMAAAALAGPVIDDLVDRPRRQQRPTLALVAGLAPGLAPRPILAPPRRRARRILTRRLRRVPRRALGLALQLSDPPLLRLHTLLQARDLLVHPQQHRDHDLTTLLVDRLRLRPLHASNFDAPRLCPPGPTERLQVFRFSHSRDLSRSSLLPDSGHESEIDYERPKARSRAKASLPAPRPRHPCPTAWLRSAPTWRRDRSTSSRSAGWPRALSFPAHVAELRHELRSCPADEYLAPLWIIRPATAREPAAVADTRRD
jgi:hypothetical protein